MRVLSLINGTLISETTSTYALYYAKNLGCQLSLVYIRDKEPLVMVEEVFNDIKSFASLLGVGVDLIIYDRFEELERLVFEENIDMLFCSTKNNRSLLDKSFAKKIIDAGLKVDLAIVKIVKIAIAADVEKIIMPIRGYQLSVNKFAFFASFVNAYNANAEIFSIDEIKRREIASLDAKKVKRKLQDTVFNLRHYFRLANIMGMKFSIKHNFALVEGEEVQSHIAKNSYDLAIVGGHHQKFSFRVHPIDTLFEEPVINTIYTIQSKDDK